MQLAQPRRQGAGLAALLRAKHDPVIAADDLVRSPEWLPLGVASGVAVRLVRLDEAAYRAASFLDQRLLASGHEPQSCEPATLGLAAARLTPQAHYIFHLGHVGSTLISRLVGAHPGFFALREPALLRELATGGAAGGGLALRGAQALLSRTWRTSQRAVVKVTSFVSELAVPMLAAPERPVGIFMYAPPLTYLRTILAGPNSRLESRELAAPRLRRLTRRFEERGWEPKPRSEGECIAMSWLCEMSALREAALRFPSQVLWVEFDAFLSRPADGLQTIFRALGQEPAARDLEALVTGPLMRQYSKAPEYPYDAALRRQVLDSAEREHAAEVRGGMEWLQAAAAATRDASVLAPP